MKILMYKDSEQTYLGFNIDIYDETDSNGNHLNWVADYWSRSNPEIKGTIKARKRKDAMQDAKTQIFVTVSKSKVAP